MTANISTAFLRHDNFSNIHTIWIFLKWTCNFSFEVYYFLISEISWTFSWKLTSNLKNTSTGAYFFVSFFHPELHLHLFSSKIKAILTQRFYKKMVFQNIWQYLLNFYGKEAVLSHGYDSKYSLQVIFHPLVSSRPSLSIFLSKIFQKLNTFNWNWFDGSIVLNLAPITFSLCCETFWKFHQKDFHHRIQKFSEQLFWQNTL